MNAVSIMTLLNTPIPKLRWIQPNPRTFPHTRWPRPLLRLASEPELRQLFDDCDTGAIPALSEAYGLKVIWDDQLKHASDIYIEAGDHEHLIHLRGSDFQQLMESLPHSIISAGKEYSRWVYE